MSKEYVVESGIPLPAKGRRQSVHREPLQKLEIGDSFFVKNRETDSYSQRITIYRAAYRLGIKIAVRSEGEGFRVWRVA